MAYNDFVQAIIDAETDAGTLERIVNDAEDVQITSRLGRKIWTLATVNKKINDLSLAIQTALASGAGQGGWTDQLIATFNNQTQRQINERIKTVKDFGAIADGNANDINAVNQAITELPTINLGHNFLKVDTKPDNPMGKPYTGTGRVIIPSKNGGFRQLNTYTDNSRIWMGGEYLLRIGQRIKSGGMLVGHIFGDSTTAPANLNGGFAGADFEPQNILTECFVRTKGVRNLISISNHGVGGTSVYQMQAMTWLDTTNGSTDFFIIKYGINDASRGVYQFAQDLRSKLAEIRANPYGTVNNLSIILVMPNSTNDHAHGRDNLWFEQLRNIYVQAAKDYQCALFDTYAFMPDVEWSKNDMVDDYTGYGEGVHPREYMQNKIWSAVADCMLSNTEMTMYTKDSFVSVTLQNNWVNHENGFAIAQASMSKDGWVSLRGLIKNGTKSSGTALLQLPSNMTPITTEWFICATNSGFAKVSVYTDGKISLVTTMSDTYLSLSGVRFKIKG